MSHPPICYTKPRHRKALVEVVRLFYFGLFCFARSDEWQQSRTVKVAHLLNRSLSSSGSATQPALGLTTDGDDKLA